MTGLATSTKTRILGTDTYNNIGRLVTKKYGDNVTEQLAYNIRGWLTSKESNAFKMQLHYQNPQAGAVACYNGNISEWAWQQGSNTQQLYAFTYDNVNRLQQAAHKVKSGSNWIANSSHYEEKDITYDRNGNILTLQRTGNGALVDNLAYSYTGNQLTSLEEAVRTASAADIYAPGNAPHGTYEYDANGNMTKDNRKGLEFTYNSLNLLSQVKENGTVKATYQYTANGTKLSVRSNGNSGYDYEGSFVFTVTDNTSVLEAAHFPEGRLKSNGVNYALTDHLGSTRAMVDASGTVQQQNDYYSFGSQHVNASYADNDNRYTFSGKEQQDLLNLKMYDFGARMYNSDIARWTTVDPLTEKYYSNSSYTYCADTPVRAIDFEGKLIIFINGFHYGGEGGSSRYWKLSNERQFDNAVQKHFRDYNTMYFDGSFGGLLGFSTRNGFDGSHMSNIRAYERFNIGYMDATLKVEEILSGLERDSEGKIVEPIRLVTHSMGGAYGKGFAQAIVNYVMKYPHLYEGLQIVEYDFAPFQTEQQRAVWGMDTYQYSHANDWYAGNGRIRGANFMKTDDSKGHSIGDYFDYISSLPAGTYKIINGEFVKQ